MHPFFERISSHASAALTSIAVSLGLIRNPILTRFDNILNLVFLKLHSRNPHFTARYDWAWVQIDFTESLSVWLQNAPDLRNNQLCQLVAAADDNSIDDIALLFVRIIEWRYIDQQRIPKDFAQLRRDFELAKRTLHSLSFDALARDIFSLISNNPAIDQRFILTWASVILSLPSSEPPLALSTRGGAVDRFMQSLAIGLASLTHNLPTPALMMCWHNILERNVLPPSNGSHPSTLIKPLKHEDNVGHLLADFLADKIAHAMGGQKYYLRSEIGVNEQGTLVLRQPYLDRAEPLFVGNRIFTKLLSPEESQQLYASLTPQMKSDLILILAYASLLGDYDVHPNNILRANDALVKVDNEWALEKFLSAQRIAITDAPTPLRGYHQLAPPNHFRSYAPVFSDPVYAEKMRDFAARYNPSAVRQALRSSLEEAAHILDTSNAKSREGEPITSETMLLSFRQHIQDPTVEPLTTQQLADRIAAKIDSRMEDIRQRYAQRP